MLQQFQAPRATRQGGIPGGLSSRGETDQLQMQHELMVKKHKMLLNQKKKYAEKAQAKLDEVEQKFKMETLQSE